MAGCYHLNNYQESPRQLGNNGESGRLGLLCNGVALAGWVLLRPAGGLMGLLLILFPQFSGASRLREAVWTIAPSGVRNLCWHKGLCKPLQDTPGCAINVPDKGPQSSAPPCSCTCVA